jgi:hypothetical protein
LIKPSYSSRTSSESRDGISANISQNFNGWHYGK